MLLCKRSILVVSPRSVIHIGYRRLREVETVVITVISRATVFGASVAFSHLRWQISPWDDGSSIPTIVHLSICRIPYRVLVLIGFSVPKRLESDQITTVTIQGTNADQIISSTFFKDYETV